MEIRSDGIKLQAMVDGAAGGPPVLFIHGLSADMHVFSWLPPSITAGRRIIRFDLRGHGNSDAAAGAYALEQYSSDAISVLRELADGPAVLVGHSLGAVVAWWVAQNQPELVRAAFLEDPPLYLGEPAGHEDRIRKSSEEYRETLQAWRDSDMSPEAAAAVLAGESSRPRSKAKGEEGPTYGEIIYPESLLSGARAMLAVDLEVVTACANGSTLEGIDIKSPVSVPVLLLAADVDPAFTKADERRLAKSHPEIEITRIPGSGHNMNDEIAFRPLFTSLLVDFLDRHAPIGA